MPVSFDNMDTSEAFVSFGTFDLIHVVSRRWEMILRKLDDEDLGTILQSLKCLPRYVLIDGSKCIESPGVPDHEFLAYSWATTSCLLESLCISSSNGLTIDCEAGLRGWDEWYDFGRIRKAVEIVSRKGVGVDIHLCRPWE